MRYAGWNFEKTLLVQSSHARPRSNEFIDVRVAVKSERGKNVTNDVRVVLKKDWNVFGREIPSQVYDVKHHGEVTTFRVAFQANIAPPEKLRIGIVYDNPSARPAQYESSLTVSEEEAHFSIDNRYYHAETDRRSGRISLLAIKTYRAERCFRHIVTPEGFVQPGASLIFAHEAVSASNWMSPETVHVNRGPLFFSVTSRGKLAPKSKMAVSAPPQLEITYKFFADQPYILVSSRLEFPQDTPVFGIQLGTLAVASGMFSHYTFRPVSPTLPLTDIEEMGHILIEPELTRDLPQGLIFGGFLPYDLAWQSFINIHKGPQRKQYALTGISLDSSATCAGGEAVTYRAATYLAREDSRTRWFRAPVYVKNCSSTENIITVKAGSVYRENYVLFFSPWDIEVWAPQVEETGKRLNNPPVIEQYPHLTGVEVPPEEHEPLPYGNRGDAYLRAGVR